MSKRVVSGIILTLLLMSILTLTFDIQQAQANVTFSDHFSADSGMWEYVGTAYRDIDQGFVVLTENVTWQAGAIWFKYMFRGDFTASFKYRIGNGTGADGMVIMFFKERNYTLPKGGWMGFAGHGYGVEFDGWHNPPQDNIDDPSSNHIALIRDSTAIHLVYVNDTRTEDYLWHNVTVSVEDTSVTVFVDLDEVLSWHGTLDRTYSCFGFSAGTGCFSNWHLIDDFSIEIQGPIEEYEPPTFKEGKWDFGTVTSPLQVGWIRVKGSDVYYTCVGWGWIQSVSEENHGIGGGGVYDDVEQDNNWGGFIADRVFSISVTNGLFNVQVWQGDHGYAHGNMYIYAEDILKVDNIDCSADQWITSNFSVYVSDGVLDLRFGQTNETEGANWIVNGVSIAPLILGDVNHDGIVDIYDGVIIGVAFGSGPGDQKWNPIADIAPLGAPDNFIDIQDIVLWATHFGETA